MKSKQIDTITNNEDQVRFRIFAGDFPPDQAYQELLRLEKEQRKSDAYFYEQKINHLLEELRT